MLGLSVIILFKSLLHVFCSLVFSAHNSSDALHGTNGYGTIFWAPLMSGYKYIADNRVNM